MVSVRVRMVPVMWLWFTSVLLLLLLRFVADESDFKHRSGDTVCPSSHGGGGESVVSPETH